MAPRSSGDCDRRGRQDGISAKPEPARRAAKGFRPGAGSAVHSASPSLRSSAAKGK